MKIKENVIIVLDNKDRYIILNEITYQKEKYYLGMGIMENNQVISSKIVFLKEEYVNDDMYVKIIENVELLEKLTKELKN